MSYAPPGHPYIDLFSLTLHTVISQLPEPRSFTVNRVYNQNQSRWNEFKLSPGYRFSVAYAVDEATADERTEGSFGLGPMRFVNLFDW